MKRNVLKNQLYSLNIVFKYSKSIFFLRLILSITAGLVPAIIAYLYKLFIQNIESHLENNVFLCLGILAFVIVFNSFLSSIIDYLISFKIDCLRNKLKFDINEKISKMDYEILFNSETKTKIEMAQYAINSNIIMGYINSIYILITSIIGIVSVGYILSSLSMWFLLVLLVLLILKILITYTNRKQSYQFQEQLAPLNKEIFYYMGVFSNDNFANEMRMNSTAKLIVSKYYKLLEKSKKLFKNYSNFTLKNSLLRNVLNVFEQILFYGFLAYQMLYKNMSFADFTMCISALGIVSNHFTNMINNVIQCITNSFYVDHLREFMNIKNKIAVDNNGILIESIENKNNNVITLKDVSFYYPYTNNIIINNANLVLEKNSFYVIVGKNGAGKTTLVKLLCRLYDPTSGEIMYQKENIKNINYQSYRSNIGIVFQNYQYYEMTIAENVALDKYDGSEEVKNRIYDVLSKAGLKEKIDSLEKGILTNLGTSFSKEGILLSGGELQKLALARVLFNDCPIVILDEPTSALDPIAENELIELFQNRLLGKTVVYVSHRLSVASIADKVIFINNHTIQGFDTHENLMKNNEEYYKLYYSQASRYKI